MSAVAAIDSDTLGKLVAVEPIQNQNRIGQKASEKIENKLTPELDHSGLSAQKTMNIRRRRPSNEIMKKKIQWKALYGGSVQKRMRFPRTE